MESDIGNHLIEKAKEKGATIAGIANVEMLKNSPSHKIINMQTSLSIQDFAGINWPEYAKSALVIGVQHPESKPELDWWDGQNSPGNNILIRIIRELSIWVQEEYGIKSQEMPYSVERGGIYLKDTAVLAGLGCIGKNNLLITPEYGPQVRLRAMLLSEYLPPTGPISFDPCKNCEEYCRKICPQDAFAERVLSPYDAEGMETLPGRDGFFSRAKCYIQMNKDVMNSDIELDDSVHLVSENVKDFSSDDLNKYIKYCRKCELSCPIGKNN